MNISKPEALFTKKKELLPLFCRSLVSMFLIYILLTVTTPREVLGIARSANGVLIAGAFGLILVDRFLMAYRLTLLLNSTGVRVPFSTVLRIFFVSNFAANLLPSSAAPDVLRSYFLSKYRDISSVVPAVLVDRAVGLLSQVSALLLVIALNTNLPKFGKALADTALPLAGGILLLFVAVFLIGRTAYFEQKHAKHWEYSRVDHFVVKIRFLIATCFMFLKKPRLLATVSAIAYVNFICMLTIVYLVGKAIVTEVPVSLLLLTVPAINVLTILPISVSGIGIQEGIYVLMLAEAGIAWEKSLSLSVLLRVLMILATLPGGLIYMTRGLRATVADTSSV